MKHWWVPGLQIGYEHSFIHQAADFIDSLESGAPAAPTFRDGFATDRVTGAVLRSAVSGQWEQPSHSSAAGIGANFQTTETGGGGAR
jgi:myo-inositol 2-dehydrogenase/D-chiro-inositol 1-dehydrogenase